MHNEECQLVCCVFYPILKLAIVCIFLKKKELELDHKGGTRMVDLLSTNKLCTLHFDVGLALTYPTSLYIGS
jgi:hypothetical protein